MRKLRMLAVAAVATGALVAPAAPAHASCQTDVGDVCKLVDVLCTTTVGQKYIGYCK
jgi:hypothetical protein